MRDHSSIRLVDIVMELEQRVAEDGDFVRRLEAGTLSYRHNTTVAEIVYRKMRHQRLRAGFELLKARLEAGER